MYKLYYYIGCRRELVFIYLFILSPERKKEGRWQVGGKEREKERESDRERNIDVRETSIHCLLYAP